MGTEITKQTSEQLTFGRAPEEFTRELLERLITLQDAFRTKVAETELDLWVQTLGSAGASIGEIDEAIKEYFLHPPKQQLSDGTIQDWRGMPMVQDIVKEVGKAQKRRDDAAIADYQQREKERTGREDAEWKAYAEAHPDEYENVGNVWEFLHAELQKMKKAEADMPLGPLPEEIRRAELKVQFAEHEKAR